MKNEEFLFISEDNVKVINKHNPRGRDLCLGDCLKRIGLDVILRPKYSNRLLWSEPDLRQQLYH